MSEYEINEELIESAISYLDESKNKGEFQNISAHLIEETIKYINRLKAEIEENEKLIGQSWNLICQAKKSTKERILAKATEEAYLMEEYIKGEPSGTPQMALPLETLEDIIENFDIEEKL